jgi:Kef-type K+ transport system membrane component KefB
MLPVTPVEVASARGDRRLAVEGISSILVDLFLIFTLAKITGRLFVALGQPSIAGEVLVGILIGPYALGWIGTPDASLIHLFGGDEEAAQHAMAVILDVIAELGVIILLFFVGLETSVRDLVEVRGRATLVAVLGILFPFALGFGFMYLSGRSNLEAAFIATTMVATSVGITARVLGDLGVLQSQEARIILGAAVVDDILSLLLLSIVSGIGGGAYNLVEIGLTALQAVLFVLFAVFVGTKAVRRFSVRLGRVPVRNASLIFAIGLMLGLSALSGSIGLAAIIGAFLAGLMLAEAEWKTELEEQARPIYEFLVPFFFVVTGAKVNLAAFGELTVLGMALLVTVLAVAGKFAAGWLAARGLSRRSAAIIGVGMVPRGEVGLIAASIGLSKGAISGDMFSALVFMSLATTLLAPPLLVRLYRGKQVTLHDRNAGADVAGEPTKVGDSPQAEPLG